MKSLFIDTTYDISIGLLNEDLSWDQFETFSGKKASEIIQSQTHELISKAQTDFSQISKCIAIAGPGFYTGLRLSEGFADVLSFSGIVPLSFYAYKIPKFLGIKSGVWGTKAYRGEYFFHQWSEAEDKNILLSSSELEAFAETIKKEKFYIHCDSAIDEKMKNLFEVEGQTIQMLQMNPKCIFDKVSEKVESFYFRAPEDEFKANP